MYQRDYQNIDEKIIEYKIDMNSDKIKPIVELVQELTDIPLNRINAIAVNCEEPHTIRVLAYTEKTMKEEFENWERA